MPMVLAHRCGGEPPPMSESLVGVGGSVGSTVKSVECGLQGRT